MSDICDALLTIMERGGPVMWPIAFCSVLIVAVVLRKVIQWSLFAVAVRRGRDSWQKVAEALRCGDRDAALDYAVSSPSPYAALVRRAAAVTERPFHEALEAGAHRCLRRLAFGLGLLDTVVTVSPMLGILGTVTGIIASFSLMGSSGTEDPTGVAAGIAEALLTTAAGLIVSMLALLPYNAGRVLHAAMTRNMEQALSDAEPPAEG